MPTILESWTDVADEEYADFLDMALDWFGYFSLVWRDASTFDDTAIQLRRDLDRHEVNRRRVSHWPGTRVFHTKGPVATIITYRLDQESRRLLGQPASLFAWLAPAYPEDLAFYQRDGRLAFATCTHERLAWAIDLDFGYSVPKSLGFTPRETDLTGEGGFEYVA